MNRNSVLGPIIIRFTFFIINFLFTIYMVEVEGWSVFAIMFAAFSTRDLVQGVRLAHVYYLMTKNSNDNDNQKK